MKKILIPSFILQVCLSVSVGIFAQCDQALVESQEYSWTKLADVMPKKMGAQYPKAKLVVNNISAIVQGLYPKPKGAEISWYGYFTGTGIDQQYANPYSVDIMCRRYNCSHDKPTLNGESESSIFVFVNDLGWMGTKMMLNGKEYRAIRAITRQNNGYRFFSFFEGQGTKMEDNWLLTYPGQTPFTYLSRKEFLQEARADQQKEMETMIASFPGRYKGRPQKELEDAILDCKKMHAPILGIIDNYLLQHSEAELAEPAIVYPYGVSSFRGFAEKLSDKNMVYLLKDNPSYYKKSLSPAAPQYISVLIRYPNKGMADKYFITAIKQQQLFDQLSALLGK